MKSQPMESSAFADSVAVTVSAKADDSIGCDFMSLKLAPMKRPLALLAVPLVLAALMFGVKWRAEHPTPTKEDLEVRTFLSSASRTVVSYYPSKSSQAYHAVFPQKYLQPLIQSFYFSKKTPQLIATPLTFYGTVLVDSYTGEPQKLNTPIISVRLDLRNRQKSSIIIRSKAQKEYGLHPVTAKRWIELLLANPRIGPELRKRMK